jgi:FrmR/RcnR family transcriptional regulator, repressor of frmRAB operon
MAGQTSEEKTRLLQRVRRLRGQVEAIERALEAEAELGELMQLTVSVRGAASSLVAELLEAHVRAEICDPAHERDRDRAKGARQLIDVLHAYIK